MSTAVAAGGWLVATVAIAAAVVIWRAFGGRMELVARASHELRGPITAARLGLALGERAGTLSPEQLRAVELELGRAGLALDDLAGAGARGRGCRRGTRPTAGRAVFDLGELLQDSVQAWRAGALARGVELTLERPPEPSPVCGDRIRVAQATGNLIANALEHGEGEVRVRMRLLGGSARVEFTDSGAGLPAPLATLARRRRRGRGEHGRGLGIALAIAVGHGGRLAAAPTVRGARIVLDLPLTGAPVLHGTGPEPTERPWR